MTYLLSGPRRAVALSDHALLRATKVEVVIVMRDVATCAAVATALALQTPRTIGESLIFM
jgi:hypothetical protein